MTLLLLFLVLLELSESLDLSEVIFFGDDFLDLFELLDLLDVLDLLDLLEPLGLVRFEVLDRDLVVVLTGSFLIGISSSLFVSIFFDTDLEFLLFDDLLSKKSLILRPLYEPA